MTQDVKDAQIGRLARELIELRTEAGHVDQRLETIRERLRHAFCENRALELRNDRLYDPELDDFVPSLDEYAKLVSERGSLAARIIDTDRKLRELGIAVDRLRASSR